MARKTKESVSVSFHYLLKQNPADKNEDPVGFSQDEFDALVTALDEQEEPDLSDPITFERVRFGSIIPFLHIERKDKRTAFGTFKAPYTGHSFENSEKGEISADSVNQRQFQFLLYLAENGRLYVGAQYLGNYGGWLALSGGLKRLLGEPGKILSFSFRNNTIGIEQAVPKKVQVQVNRQSHKAEQDARLSRKAMVTFQRTDDEDDTFEDEARKKILPLLGQSIDKIRKGVSEELAKDGLVEINEDDIENCVLIADVNGKEKTFYFLDELNVSTRFQLSVPLNDNGHPPRDITRQRMYNTLEHEIISKLGSEA